MIEQMRNSNTDIDLNLNSGNQESSSGSGVAGVNSDIYSLSLRELVENTCSGKYGNDAARRQALGSRFKEIQALVNKVMKGKLDIESISNVRPGEVTASVMNVSSTDDIHSKSQRELVEEVIAGKYGIADARKQALGDRYTEIQPLVNKVVKGQLSIDAVSNERASTPITEILEVSRTETQEKMTSAPALEEPKKDDIANKSQKELVEGVLAGKYGAGDDRKIVLGDRYREIQQLVNMVVRGQITLESIGNPSYVSNSGVNTLGATSGVLPNARIGASGRPAASGYYSRSFNPFPLNGGGAGVGGNCTYYAYSRFSELLGEKATGICLRNANHWFNESKGYKTGQEPRLGAIAVWKYPNRDSGHVAIVEEIKENGDIVTSQGGWSNKSWYYNKTYSASNNYAMDAAGTKKLLGFIYPEKI